ncbi:MAG: SPOR domain-containing protein [Tabrizicola sp.]
MRGLMTAAALIVLATPALARDPIRPAELPPSDYAGEQYVDSRGCMFVRAGTGSRVVWVPRVSRDGTPDCDNPPSGRRVPVAEEIGVQPYDPGDGASAAAATPEAGEPAPRGGDTGGYFVAVGSFGIAENADRAEAKLRSLGHSVVRGRVQGGNSTLITVFAGPFPDESAAAKAGAALRDNGFPDAVVMGR